MALLPYAEMHHGMHIASTFKYLSRKEPQHHKHLAAVPAHKGPLLCAALVGQLLASSSADSKTWREARASITRQR